MTMTKSVSADSLIEEITTLRLKNVDLDREKAILKLLIDAHLKENKITTDEASVKLDQSKSELQSTIDQQREEVTRLREKLNQIKSEKQDLELTLKMVAEHSDDMTESLYNEIEATLLEGQKQFQVILETIPVPIVINRSHDYSIVYVNDPAATLFGLSKEQLLKRKITDFIDPFCKQALSERLAETQILSDFEINGRMIDSTPFWAVLFIQPLSYNTEHCLLNVLYDQTDRRRIEKERARLAMAIEHCADGVAITDNLWNVQYINPAFESITGYSGTEFSGENLNLLKSDRQTDSPYEEIESMLRENDVWSGRMVSRKKDGTHYEAEISVSFIRDEIGEIINYVVVHRDITYEVQLENQLRQAQKMEAVGTLSGGIAHDFNNILSAVLGYSELALLKAGDNVGLVRSIRQIHKAGQRATALVRQILTFSRKTIQEKTICRMSLIVKEALEMLRSTIPTTIEIKHKINCKGTILADATQIHQIVVNLCTNAYHAMRETGGILEIELLEKEILQKNIRDLMLEPGKYVLLRVKDTGCGMDDEIMEKMFEPYFSTKMAEEGTGLGLSVVHGIVKGHGGEINAQSEPGKGSVFQIYLPLVEAPEKVKIDQEDEMPMAEGSETIMFVDDEDSLVELARESFGECGYKIKTFENGEQALQAFQQKPYEYDLIVTDMNMPLLNGMDLAREVMRLRPSIPVVLCTGYSKLINKEKAFKMGIRGYLEKPLTMGRLMREVRSVLDN